MSHVTLESPLDSILASLKERTEIRDADGKLLGIYEPAARGKSLRDLFDPEELRRRKQRAQNDPGRSLDEVMRRIQARGAPCKSEAPENASPGAMP